MNAIDNHAMQRWEIPSFGLDKLTLRGAPLPAPQPGELLVAVEAVSLNYRDGEVVDNGMYATLTFPFTPGSDMAGRVVAVGEGVTRFAAGDRVISSFFPGWIDGPPRSWAEAPSQGGPIPGMLSQYVATPAEWCVAAPASLTAAEASTLPVAGLTAWMALVELGQVRPGDNVVVQGTGGVSLFAIQLAKAQGARVIVTSGGADKLARALALGADDGIDRGARPDWDAAVQELTGGRGAEHVLEMAGGDNLARTLRAVRPGGRVSVIGLLESDRLGASVMALLASRATVTGIAVGPRRALEDLVRAVDRLGLKPVIDATYPFEQAPQAFAHLRRGAFGKIVITLPAR